MAPIPEAIPLQSNLMQERRRILYEWNDTRAEYPDVCVHELFERQVERDPEAVAVVFQERRLSYREVNGRANQVAHRLRKLGVGPESLVGVCLERSPELVIALLGVWKAGGAYVPLDPGYPRERLEFMLRDAGVKVLLTEEKGKGFFCSSSLRSEGRVVCLDTDWGEMARESGDNLAAVARPSDLAYVMYTSGSTGEPKGVMILQRGLVNYLWWAMRAYAVEGKGAVPVHSSIAFDSTVASLYPPLLSGGRVELVPEDAGAQGLPAALGEGNEHSKVVVTPAHLELVNHLIRPEEMASASKVLVVAGEALLAERLSPWRDFAPATRLFNEYGPTEATVGCSAYEVQVDDARSGPVPIGRPIANTQLYVLDANLQPVPVGEVGELYIGGAGVARGYLNRPELTRERFLHDTFSEQVGARLYKSGDLARYREDGTLECLGRVDDQVKIRGFRIELGEIESALVSHPGVQSCLVLAQEDAPGNKQLVSYVIARGSESLEADVLRNFLRQRLPDYMVPAYFVFLDSLPLNQNGKVDREALPAPPYKNVAANQSFVAPRNETEMKLAAIWMELLKVERVGIHDDFFDLGGDSLMAIRARSRIHDAFGVAPSLESIFSVATIAALSETLNSLHENRNQPDHALPVQQSKEEPPICWIGGGAQASLLSAQMGSNGSFLAFGIGPEIIDQLKAPYQIEEIAARLALAIRTKQQRGPYRLGGYCLSAVFAYEVARQLMMLGHDVDLLALIEPLNPWQHAKVRFTTGLRRMSIRIDVRFREFSRLEITEIPSFARSRWKNLNSVLRDVLWRVSARSRFLNPQLRSSDLEKVLFFAASSYRPKPLACRTVIFRSTDSPILSAGDPYFGWRDLLKGRTETHEIPGDHQGIFRDPNVRVLAGKLRDCLRSAGQTAPAEPAGAPSPSYGLIADGVRPRS